MMQDYPKLLSRAVPEAKVGFTAFDRWLAFSPAKNNLQAARDLAAAGEPAGSAGSCEFDYYKSHAKRVGLGGDDDDESSTKAVGGVDGLYAGPTVVFKPSFALTQADLDAKIDDLVVDDGAALVVAGNGVHIKSLAVKNSNALYIDVRNDDATLVVDGLVLDGPDAGLEFTDVPDDQIPDLAPADQIRGFTTNSDKATRITIDEPGTFSLGADGRLRPGPGADEL